MVALIQNSYFGTANLMVLLIELNKTKHKHNPSGGVDPSPIIIVNRSSFSPYEGIYKLPIHLMEERIAKGHLLYKHVASETKKDLQ